MKSLATTLCAALIAIASAGTADAAAKKKQKRAKAAAAPAAQAAPPKAFGPPRTYRQEPARMIEISPGRWISSWGCFTDEGYGRYSSCDQREGD